jgi:phosphoglycerate dehydrogenase-like enzyme
VRVWVPYFEWVADVEKLSPEIAVDVYTGEGRPPGSVAGVDFYVAPYSFSVESLELTREMESLRVLQLLTAGYEHVLQYVPEGVTVCNARGVHDASTAELALTLMLSSLRGIPDFVRAQRHGHWAHADYPALADKTVLILGYGSIGEAIEQRLIPFEVNVIRVASRARPDAVHGVDELPELLPQADVVVAITPLTPATRHLVDGRFLAAMRDGALLVNVSRGGVVDTDALVLEVESGRLRAALDVTDPEPLPSDHPLWSAPGVLISPHVGGNSSAFLPRAARLVRLQLAKFVAGDPVDNVVAGPATGNVAKSIPIPVL